MQSHIRKVDACLAVTCHLHFWQNDRDLLRATAIHGGGTDTGNSGTDTGNSVTDTGNSGTDTGNSGTDTGNSGTATVR